VLIHAANQIRLRRTVKTFRQHIHTLVAPRMASAIA